MAKITFIMHVRFAKGWAECIVVVPAVGTIVSFQDQYAPVQEIWYDIVRNSYHVYLGVANENGEPVHNMRDWKVDEAVKYLKKAGFKVGKVH